MLSLNRFSSGDLEQRSMLSLNRFSSGDLEQKSMLSFNRFSSGYLEYMSAAVKDESEIDNNESTIMNILNSADFKPHIIIGYPGCKATNVIEVYSITISNQADGSLTDNLELYGDISLIDADNNTYTVYNRGYNEPDSISPSNKAAELSLYHSPMAPGSIVKVKLTLTDKITNNLILDGELYTPFDCDDDHRECDLTLQGTNYYATMVFSFNPFSVIGEITMSITASHVDIKPIQGKLDGYIRVNGISCFKSIALEPYITFYGEQCYSIELSRTAVTVPIYDFLWAKFDLQLDDGQDFATGLFVKNPNFLTIKQMPERLSEYCNVDGYSINIVAECAAPDEYFARGRSELCHSRLCGLSTSTYHVEVFSVVFGCNTYSDESIPPALFGTIVVADPNSKVSVFSYETRTYKLTPNEQKSKRAVLSLEWPDDCLVRENGSIMNVCIEDVQGNTICHGGLHFCQLYEVLSSTRYDRRMCVTIKQEGYFAAVHYAVFTNGKRAKVTLEWEGTSKIFVYGSVSAEYVTKDSNLDDYRTTYDQKYYRSIIFKKSMEDPVLVESCCRIPLSKSLVTTPSDCKGLLFHVDLEVICCEVFSIADGKRIHNPKLWMAPDDAIQHLRVYHSSSDTWIGYITIKVEFN